MRWFGGPDKGFAKQRPGPTNCGWRLAWERGRRPTDLASRNPGAPEWARNAYSPVMRCRAFFYISIKQFAFYKINNCITKTSFSFLISILVQSFCFNLFSSITFAISDFSYFSFFFPKYPLPA